MKVLVTGATGYVGQVVVKQLKQKNYEVVGLCRNEKSAQKLKDLGAVPLLGDIKEPEKIANAAKDVDGIIHLAFIHDFGNYDDSISVDLKLISAITEAIQGTNKPFITTSATSISHFQGEVGVIDDFDIVLKNESRGKCEVSVLSAKDKGVRSSVVRLPPFVYGLNGSSFIPSLIKTARERGESNYVEGLTNELDAVHVEDAARIYILALEKGKAGSIYNAATQGVQFRKLAEAVAQNVGVPAKPIKSGQAKEVWGEFLAHVFQLNTRTTSNRSRSELGWVPTNPVGVIEDVVRGSYKN
ncbi:hypothetical protein AKO1_003829 [Acrasis kona]|uniref:NAD-dependent epimerase/dehydratase domain-containing protein n=1 Tax=Acrasis kona TaxID=1008807 RepID=A0AAW2Z698_9EUKA